MIHRRLGSFALGVFALGAIATDARAYISDTDACGSSPAGWSVPKGGAVASRGRGGAITRLMDSIGEYFSHQMLAHGNGWISHATMKTPGLSVGIIGDDQVDGNDLKWGWPGPAQVTRGATYQMLDRGNGAEAVKWVTGGTAGATTADWLWGVGANALPSCSSVTSGPCWTGAYSQKDSNAMFYLIARKDTSGTVYRHSYGLYQYQDSRNVQGGDDTSSMGWTQQCSTMMSWALQRATGQTVTPKFYANSTVGPAAWTLHSAVSSDCSNDAGWFGGLFVNCDDVADQIVNCFTAQYYGDFGKCDDDRASTWQGFATFGTASSVSPDRVIGRGASGGGPWAGQMQNDVYWNSGGAVYGCFF